MKCSGDELRLFGGNVQRLIERRDLSREESYEMFRQVLLDLQPDLQQGAFLAALVAKGETADEIAGAWQAIVELDTVAVEEPLAVPLVENSGTGMDQLKTFNVSTAAAVVAAAGGARLARHGARALTSVCGTVDLLDALGIDVECDVSTVARSVREVGIGLFNGMSSKVHPRSLFRILSQIRFGSTLNIAASLASPCRPTHALRGVYSRELIPKVAQVMKAIGYRRALVVHGLDGAEQKGMDELSSIGPSLVQELKPNGSMDTYSLTPEDVGLRRANFTAVAAGSDIRGEAVRFLQVMSGSGHPECIDFTCLNAGAILYLVGLASDIGDGVVRSIELIHNGAALAKLSRWVATQADSEHTGLRRYVDLAREAGIDQAVNAHL